MKKLVFFVEGTTEMLFVEKLLTEIAEKNDVHITKKRIRGGGKSGKVRKTITEVDAVGEVGGERFFVLIYDCGNDSIVAQRIKDEHSSLTAAGYEKIVGIRDVRPDFTKDEIPRLERGMRMYLKTSLAPVVFILSTMEIEAWFLAEYNHFTKVHEDLTVEFIESATGLNLRTFDSSLREHPAADMSAIYRLRGLDYEKFNAAETISKLDFDFIYAELSAGIPEIGLLSNTIDEFLSSAS